MAHYVIEMLHTDQDCLFALDTITELGMGILHHSWWGCGFGVHTGWLDIEVDSEQDALGVIPPEIRKQARIVQVQRLTTGKVKALHQ
ncbi:MAG: hypothetical protein ACE5Q6_05190 [Dehalococcoidia bacterium]